MDADELERRIRGIMRDLDMLMDDVRAHLGEGNAPYTDRLMERTDFDGESYGLYVAKGALRTLVYSNKEAHEEGLHDEAEELAAESRERLRLALLPPAEQRRHSEEAEARRREYWRARDN
jgi:hypothetical protein